MGLEGEPHFTRTCDGDMPSHIKMVLTRTRDAIPFSGGRLRLGARQGIVFWEHRRSAHRRQLIVMVSGEEVGFGEPEHHLSESA